MQTPGPADGASRQKKTEIRPHELQPLKVYYSTAIVQRGSTAVT